MPRIKYSRESRSRTVDRDSRLSGEASDFALGALNIALGAVGMSLRTAAAGWRAW
jgi:hypothetical protein